MRMRIKFVADKGSRSVFGEMDAKELKLEYAKCAENDGYYYNTEKVQTVTYRNQRAWYRKGYSPQKLHYLN